MQVQKIGIPWFDRDDYPNIIRLFVDGDKLPKTYDEWLKRANNVFNRLRSEGKIVVKANINSKTFGEWCNSRGLNIDSNARLRFANEFAAFGNGH